MSSGIETRAFTAGGVRGLLDVPEGARDGLVLAHGAGGDARMPLLAAVASAFAARGIAVLRIDLPFRQQRRTGPPSPSTAAADRAGIAEAIGRMRELVAGSIFAGGQSYGGRQTSMLAAGEAGAAALLLLSYPLHPPGKPESLRIAHFSSLHLPTLFIHGTRDPFATPVELETAAKNIPGPARLVEVTGAGHDLFRGRFDVCGLVVTPLLELTGSHTR
jgi:uncharacterized protein